MGILLFISLTLFTFSVFRRILPLFAMQPEKRWDRPFSRFGKLFKFAIGQARFFQRFEVMHGFAHVLIFWGFLVVSINTIHLVGRGFVCNWYLPGFEASTIGSLYAFLKDLFVLAVMIGTMLALGRRIFLKPERLTLSWEANLILLLIFTMMLLDVFYSGTLFLMFPENPEQAFSFMGVFGTAILVKLGFGNDSNTTLILHHICFWGHLIMVFVFLNYLPYGKHFHVVTSLPGVFFSKLMKKGELTRQDFESEDIIFGACKLEEFSWKRALDMYNCTECGRCQDNCPAYISDKPLSPKKLVMEEREHLKARTSQMCIATYHKFKNQPEKAQEILDSWAGEMLTGQVIKEDVIWSCTTCGHCIEICPLLIEHVDNIVDMRRYLVQLGGRFPKELNAVYKGWENMSNPWGLASNSRSDWFDNLGVKKTSENQDFEYLYYVGCAGSFDDRNKKVSTAFVRLMQTAGLEFACMGNDEKCCGETARRLGNEYLGQSMIKNNVQMWKDLGIKKIITTCPHCYNTLKNEYPLFGGKYEVFHHTEIILKLIQEGKISPTFDFNLDRPIVYHDPCYLGRYNSIYDTPRSVLKLGAGLKIVEPQRHRSISFCCGAGGGRMWMEEKIGKYINLVRCEQLLETKANTIGTACPYCLIMLEDALKEIDLENKIKVLDLAELIENLIQSNT